MKVSKMHARVLSKAPYQRVSTDTPARKEEGFYGQWGWEGPNKADKGKRLGSCNVTRCQRSGAFWYNSGTGAYYCTSCAHKINYRPLPNGNYLCTRDEAAMAEYDNALKGE